MTSEEDLDSEELERSVPTNMKQTQERKRKYRAK